MLTRWAQRVAVQRAQLERQQSVPETAPVDPVRRTRVGPADDRYEREADAVAARVVDNVKVGGSIGAGTATAVQRLSSEPIGREGGEVDGHVQSALDRTRGHGSALGASVRTSMEGAFGGADFGGVRVHSGAESADLNARLGARAFTVGSDIYLGANTPALSSGNGRQLLAHELTHTLQQSGDAQRSVLRRLSVDKPLTNITSIDVEQRGASGKVATVTDGSTPVIVKANQANAVEVLAADKMQRQGKFKSGSFKVKAPKSRMATAADKQALIAASTQPGVLQPNPRSFLAQLGGTHPTLIAESMGGETLQSSIDGMVTSVKTGTKKNRSGKDVDVFDHTRHDKEIDDVKQLVKKTAPLKVLAKASATDVAMGAGDRLMALFNAENFKYDPAGKRFFFIDNTTKNSQGALTSQTQGNNQENARSAFDEWAGTSYVGQLATQPDELAKVIVGNFTGLGADGSEYSPGFGLIAKVMSMSQLQNDKNAVRDELHAIITANYGGLLKATEEGLKSGRETVLKSLASPLALTKGAAPAARQEAVTSLLARRNVLKGMDPSSAWTAAHRQALKLLKLTNQPEQLPYSTQKAQNMVRDNARLLA